MFNKQRPPMENSSNNGKVREGMDGLDGLHLFKPQPPKLPVQPH